MSMTLTVPPTERDAPTPCPHCGNKSLTVEFDQMESQQVTYPNFHFIVRRCLHCKRFSFIHNMIQIKRPVGFRETTLHRYPSAKITELENPAIPDKVKADYVEGLRGLNNGCYKSACVMFRRAIQNAVIELGASKRKKLDSQIDQLERKRIITPELKDLAHEMRIVGNKGAHPLKTEFDELTPKDAHEAASFLHEFINYSFILRKRLQDRKAKAAPPPTNSE